MDTEGENVILKQEIENVLQIDKSKQYEYFLKKVADFEEVWSLKDDKGWVTLGIGGDIFFPIWPKKEFADICISDEWNNCYPESIELEEFLEYWIGGLKEDNIRITIMWNNGNGIDVAWDVLREDIRQELEKY